MYVQHVSLFVYVLQSLCWCTICSVVFQAEDGIRDLVRSRGLGDVYKRQTLAHLEAAGSSSLPITRGVIEALRDEPDQDVLGLSLIHI